jgi:hypothetical protein
MAARELGDPLAVCVQVETDNLTLHSVSVRAVAGHATIVLVQDLPDLVAVPEVSHERHALRRTASGDRCGGDQVHLTESQESTGVALNGGLTAREDENDCYVSPARILPRACDATAARS